LELGRRGVPAEIFEQDRLVGGISRTVEYRGFRFDIGGHRLYTKAPEVEALWHDLLGDELLVRQRLSRILYRGRLFDYPLKPVNALVGLGPWEAVRIAASYARARLRPHAEEETFEQWVVNRFGRRLYQIFFETYTEKVWGIPPSRIGAEWAAQRIKNLDLVTAVRNALFGGGGRSGEVVTTLIDRFLYPRLGPGQLWDACRQRAAEVGVPTHTGVRVTAVQHAGGRAHAVRTRRIAGGGEERRPVDRVISSMPLSSLVQCLDPPPPAAVLEAARRLRYRDFLTVVLIIDRAELFPDNWIYVHDPEVRVGRVQNFKNWSPDLVPDPSLTSLGLEYFVDRTGELWRAPEEELLALGEAESRRLGLLDGARVVDGTVVRMPRAYPVYDRGYAGVVAVLRRYLESFSNLACIGRNGQHRYNNQDHSMLTGLLAARNRDGADHELWDVNLEEKYLEAGEANTAPAAGDRRVPMTVAMEGEG